MSVAEREGAIFAVDRIASRRVRRGVTRKACILAVLGAIALIAAPACGGKSKSKKTTPGEKNKDPKDLEDVGPEMGDDVKTTKVGDDGKPTGGGGKSGNGDGGKSGDGVGPDVADGSGEGDGPEAPAKPPEIKPPDLDIAPAEARQRVKTHLKKARTALVGKKKDPNLAIRETKAALAVDPSNIDAVAYMAHAYYFKKLDDTAEVLLDMVFFNDVKPKQAAARANPRIWYIYGLIFDRAKNYAKALVYYEKALERDPSFKNAILNVGVHYLREGRYRDAAAKFEQLTGSLGVRTASVWTNLASAYRGLSASAGNDKRQRNEWLLKAAQKYGEAIRADKNYANAHYNMGLLYLDADPFPQGSGDMDMLKRLELAKQYFSDYRHLPGADLTLVNERTRRVNKLIKKETKRRKKAADRAKKAAAKKKKDAAKKKDGGKKDGDKKKDDDWDEDW